MYSDETNTKRQNVSLSSARAIFDIFCLSATMTGAEEERLRLEAEEKEKADKKKVKAPPPKKVRKHHFRACLVLLV